MKETVPLSPRAIWDIDAITELVTRLRRAGVPAYEGMVCPDGSMQFSFEREAIGQKLSVETVLMAWPGVESVQHVAPGRVRACRTPARSGRNGRRRGRFRRA